MERASDQRHPNRRLRHWRVALQSGAFAAVLLAATMVAAQAGGLWEKLFTGQGPQRTEASGSSGSDTLATAHLRVEGMV
jgi:hypothetical protein